MSGVDPSELLKIVRERQKNVTTLHEQILHVEKFKAGVPETTITVLRAARIFDVTDIDTADAKLVDLKQDLYVCRLLCTPIFILYFSHPFATCVLGLQLSALCCTMWDTFVVMSIHDCPTG